MTVLERGEGWDEGGREHGAEDGGGLRSTRAHISAAGLRARGWTPGMVRRLLGEPDLLRVNPHFRAAPQIRLYLVERVESAERSEEFRAVAAAAARRSASAKVATQRRRQEMLARIAAEPVDVPRLAERKLAAMAVDHHNCQDGQRNYERWGQSADPPTADGTGPPDLDRWKVDYLRHRLTRYDELLSGLHGSTGRAAAEDLLRRRVYTAIAEAYPHLAQECERQLREREWGPPPE
ncbi:hypothetical protein OHA71_37800 [Streptomyces sp. NBC_00444]|uniref:hypothetical protein n=1 Tax=Streptomyces sp. NBC_00444 TaxID=2975744 RepID=UPI002E21FBAF